MRVRNFVPVFLILIVLYLYMYYMSEQKYVPIIDRNFSTKYEPTATINLHRIKMYYLKNGDFFIPSSLMKHLNHINKYSGNYSLYKVPPVTLNIKSIKQFYEKDGAIFIPSGLKQIDWHNNTQIEDDRNRTGLGEQGYAARWFKDGFGMQELIETYGYNTAISEMIPLNRSLQDFRPEGCKERLYLESLPTVSVIVVIHNEHLHTLSRTVYSILHRTPEYLIKELFLVDNAGDDDFNTEKLEKVIQEAITKVKVVRLDNSTSLAAARVAGAKLAIADVLVFLDSHTEVTNNWLPPLLEPIALDYRTTVVPRINEIDYYTFQYYKTTSHRGLFNWTLHYIPTPLTPKDEKLMPDPFQTPVMWGMLAISRTFFWELGGYDTSFDEMGGENFEISFKIWQCGGRLLEAPCSHVGRIVPNGKNHHPHVNYLSKNHRRIAEVWMDEYAKYLYVKRPEYKKIDPGDLTEQKALRQRRKCKPFKWFMTQIAFDLCQQFPPIDPEPYSEGRIRPQANKDLCVDGNYGKNGDVVQLNLCYIEHMDAKDDDQNWTFTWYNEIKLKSRDMCLDAPDKFTGGHIKTYECHRKGGNQQWKYNSHTKHLEFDQACLDHNPRNRDLFVNRCDNISLTQLWEFDVVNKTQLEKWNESHAIRVTGPIEEWQE